MINESGELTAGFKSYTIFIISVKSVTATIQSVQSKTNYTAAELNSYIDQELARREKLYPVTYKDATKLSKLKNIGSSLKQVEEVHYLHILQKDIQSLLSTQ
jgi:hypothetical protein